MEAEFSIQLFCSEVYDPIFMFTILHSNPYKMLMANFVKVVRLLKKHWHFFPFLKYYYNFCLNEIHLRSTV